MRHGLDVKLGGWSERVLNRFPDIVLSDLAETRSVAERAIPSAAEARKRMNHGGAAAG